LVSDISGVEKALGEHDLEHGDDTGELEVIETLLERLVLVNNSDVGDLVDLVESDDAVLDKLSKFDRTFDGVRHALDDDLVVASLSSTEKLVSSLEVAADANASLDSDFVGRKHVLCLLNSAILFSHCLF